MAAAAQEPGQSPFEKVTTICQLIDNYSLANESITLQAGSGTMKAKKQSRVFTPCKGVGTEILLQQMDPSKGKPVIVKKSVASCATLW